MTTPIQKIFLFDEYGTPTFESGRESDTFLGLSCLYDKNDELEIFEKIHTIIGLENKTTKKSTELSIEKSIQLAAALSSLNISITVAFLDLNDTKLEKIIKEYHKIGNEARLQIRAQDEKDIRERKITQLLHSNILAFCMHEPIANLLNRNRFPFFVIEPYIDHWCIPKCDFKNYIELMPKDLQDQINVLITELGLTGSVTINKIEMLRECDTQLNLKRKRTIDCVTGIVSKNFNPIQNLNHTKEPIKVLHDNLKEKFTCVNYNKDIINFITFMIEDVKQQLVEIRAQKDGKPVQTNNSDYMLR